MGSLELGGCKLTDEVENYMGRIGVKGGRDGESGNENSAMCERRECDCERQIMNHAAMKLLWIPATFPLSATSGSSWPCEFGSSRRKSVESIFLGALLLSSNIGQRLHLKELWSCSVEL